MTHPTKGTCSDLSCSLRTLCHCGCGTPTGLASQNRRADSKYGLWVKGEPMIWLNGPHWLSVADNYWETRLARGSYISRERLIPMIDLLRVRHGSFAKAADAIGVPRSTLAMLRYSTTRKSCFVPTAKLIVAAVQEIRHPTTDPVAEYEPRRLPSQWERERARLEQQTKDRQRYRKQRALREEMA